MSLTGGLIPAHAGKTPTRARTVTWRWAHPRSRGENATTATRTWNSRGSSPLTRGKLPRSRPSAISQRLIPAHAGKTGAEGMNRGRSRAHPRSRGENPCQRGPEPYPGGSSPLTRGKRNLCGLDDGFDRLIPAHAGKTRDTDDIPDAQRAHPRSRGENNKGGDGNGTSPGSSPLTRGKQRPGIRSRTVHGLIPAHAGKTTKRPCPMPSPKAHPRSRGENSANCTMLRRKSGSSPLTRGKRLDLGDGGNCHGLIPAHAGKTQARVVSQRFVWAHPRSRGENRDQLVVGDMIGGSSPLTRGKRSPRPTP